MEDEKTLFTMMNLLQHLFDEYLNRVQNHVENLSLEDFNSNQSGSLIEIMKKSVFEIEKDMDLILSDMKESKSIDITDLMKAIEDATNKGGNNGEGGLH